MATGDARAQNRKEVFKRKQRTQTRDGDCRFGVEEDWTGAHTITKRKEGVWAAATAVTAMGSPSLSLSRLCCGLCERHCSATAGTL